MEPEEENAYEPPPEAEPGSGLFAGNVGYETPLEAANYGAKFQAPDATSSTRVEGPCRFGSTTSECPDSAATWSPERE